MDAKEQAVKEYPVKDITRELLIRVISDNFWDLFGTSYINKALHIDIDLDTKVLIEIVERCLKDFERIYRYHEIENNVDSHKMSGYLTYWICKLKPIIYFNRPAEETVKGLNFYLNELLAVMSSLTLLNMENYSDKYTDQMKTNCPDFCGRVVSMPQLSPMLLDYFYTLRYCNINPDLLSIMYFYIDINSANHHYFSWYQKYKAPSHP